MTRIEAVRLLANFHAVSNIQAEKNERQSKHSENIQHCLIHSNSPNKSELITSSHLAKYITPREHSAIIPDSVLRTTLHLMSRDDFPVHARIIIQHLPENVKIRIFHWSELIGGKSRLH